jgi:two-component system response regulator FixJ
MTHDTAGVVAVVDDDHAVLDSLKFLLEVVGYKVVTYASAQAFLNDYPNAEGADGVRSDVDGGIGEPACLIIDHHMPGMTGLALAQKLRDDKIDIPILLITGAPSPAIVIRAAELGIERVLEKPPDESDLLEFVNKHL